jgi:D-beta-D-heptose 7-phosphate kinase/D-beta-D-heptose 1-phosphate adenosyltransferase
MSVELEQLVDRFPGVRVLAIGDVMLDEYVWGAVSRISPEAPVPVVEIERRSEVPGGAANAAAGVAALGGRSSLAGVVGDDPAAERLRRRLDESGVDHVGLVVEAGRPTTTKMRVIAHSQQVVRVDQEERQGIAAAVEEELLAWARREVEECNAVIVSDYAKGVVSDRLASSVIETAAAAGVPVVIDPKGADFAKYAGATVITPNLGEAARGAGVDPDHAGDLPRVAGRLIAALDGTALLLTRGADGISLFTSTADPVHIPAVAREVYDVTGAGDSVVSTLTLALAAGASLEDGARLANEAAAIAVGKVGTAAVGHEELRRRLADV